MQPITFNTKNFLVNGNPDYLLSGEFHYFRVPKVDWRERMQLFKDAGGNCLATYIPWLLHEPEEGEFRFSGEDWLDLECFLQTARDENLYVIARPGPYQYSELIYHGLPGWLINRYPEILAIDILGNKIGYASVSYTHPLFLEKVRRWFESVCPVLARHTVSKGGPIAFTQIDNELIGIHEWFGSLDYHPVTMGFGKEDGKYTIFLKERYSTIANLNQAYLSNFKNFSEVRPNANPPDSIIGVRQRKDYFDFYLSQISNYGQRLVKMLREFGIDTPIIHNSANPGMNAYFQKMAEDLGNQFLLGSDHYYTLGQEWPQNNPTPQYAARVFLSLETLRLLGYPPSVFELPGGSCSNWPPVTANDALTCYLTNLAFGMKGSNYYIFTGGPNPPGAGTTTDLYDYDASIGAHGEVRPLYHAQKIFGHLVHQNSTLQLGKRVADVNIGLNLEYGRSENYWKHPGSWLVSNTEAWQFLRRGVLTTALCSSSSPTFVNLNSNDWIIDNNTPLFIVSSASLARVIQDNLVSFIKGGGKLIIGPILPTMDDNFEPYSTLADFIGVKEFEPNHTGLTAPQVMGVNQVLGEVIYPKEIPYGAEVIGMDLRSNRPFAFKKSFGNGGQAIFLGLSWSHAMREHEMMFRALLSSLGWKQKISCSNPNLWTSMIINEKQAILFVLNLFTSPMTADIDINIEDHKFLLRNLTIEPITVKPIDINLDQPG